MNWGQTSWFYEDNEERRWIDFLTKKTQHHVSNGGTFDISAQVTIANEWERIAPVNVGITAGIETTHISPLWVQKTEEMVDKVILTSNHAKSGFENTVCTARDQDGNVVNDNVKCTKPLEVVNYPAKILNIKPVELDLPYKFNFLTMAQWGPRKNLENTIRWFIEEFKDDEVGLVVKTNIAKNCVYDRYQCRQRLSALLAPLSDRKCKVHLLHGALEDEEVHSLYVNPQIKALVSLTHGEGFGLPLFEAAQAGLPVVAPDWSGHLDFLYMKTKKGKSKAMFSKVEYDLQPIPEQAVWKGVLEEGTSWWYARQNSYQNRLRDIYKDHGRFKKQAHILSEWIAEEFEENKMYAQMTDAILSAIKTEDSDEDIVVLE